MKRIEKGPVRGISFKLQEEERERKDNYVPAVSAVDTTAVTVDPMTKAMLEAIGVGDMGCKVEEARRDRERRFRK